LLWFASIHSGIVKLKAKLISYECFKYKREKTLKRQIKGSNSCACWNRKYIGVLDI